MPNPEVLVVIGDATETLDTLYPYMRLQEAGFTPVVIAPERHRYQMVLHEVKPGWTITKEWEGYTLQSDLAFREVDPERYAGIFFSGGRAPEYIRYDKDLVRITKHFFEKNKPIASVCHGVEIPAYADCVRGRKMATVPKCQFDLEVCGGTFVNEPCVIDGNLISGRTYHDNGRYIAPWIRLLEQSVGKTSAPVAPPSLEDRGEVLIAIGDATETMDTMYPYYRLQESNFRPVIIAPQQRRYQLVMHEVKPGWTITREWEGYTLQADLPFKDVNPDNYYGILFSGGRAPEYVRYDKDLVRITKHFFEKNKPVGCVCHGVEIPAYADCVRGRKMATVPKCQFDLEVCGGTYVNEPCVIDGNLISGRGFQDSGFYVPHWIKLLEAARAAN